jgi:hypothetical protein
MLTYKKSNAPLEIMGYSDSDFVGYLDTEKSTSGYIFTLTNGAISWKSSKQTITTSSMIYVELVACDEATGQALWFKKFVPGHRVIDNIESYLRYTVTMSQQYNTPTTTRKVMLPNTTILTTMLLRRKFKITVTSPPQK